MSGVKGANSLTNRSRLMYYKYAYYPEKRFNNYMVHGEINEWNRNNC